jgi:concanavalin A-like lectin/glucanase superfamily protein
MLALAAALLSAVSALVSCNLAYLGPGCSESGCADGSTLDGSSPDATSDGHTKPHADAAADAPASVDADAATDAPTTPDVAAGGYAAAIAEAGPIAWYRFEEEAGTTVLHDSSGNGRDGTYHGAVSLGQPGIAGSHSALFKDMGWALVPSPDGGVLDFSGTTPFSTEIWIDTTVITSAVCGQTVYAKEISADGGPDIGWDLFLDPSTGAPDFQREQGAVDEDDVEPMMSVMKDQWTHIVVTFESPHLILYFNGVQATEVNATAMIPPSNVALAIASDLPDVPGGDFSGYLDEFAIYDRPLSATEVLTHYTLGNPH